MNRQELEEYIGRLESQLRAAYAARKQLAAEESTPSESTPGGDGDLDDPRQFAMAILDQIHEHYPAFRVVVSEDGPPEFIQAMMPAKIEFLQGTAAELLTQELQRHINAPFRTDTPSAESRMEILLHPERTPREG
jgi:hypothetical protein